MAKDEQSFMDWLVEDIANTIEIKGAVEASRDENGRVDKWKAAGIAMGLGHTSDDELATLAGFLGAEGAFDGNSAQNADEYANIPLPSASPVPRAGTAESMSEMEYERRKQSITLTYGASVRRYAAAAGAALVGEFVGLGCGSTAVMIVCLCLAMLFVGIVGHRIIQKENELDMLETEYARAKKNRVQEKKD